jgi:hypothetical protein
MGMADRFVNGTDALAELNLVHARRQSAHRSFLWRDTEMNVGSRTLKRMIIATALCGLFLGTMIPNVSHAAAPSCYVYNGQGYCEYNGRVAQAYINAYNQILLYFDTPVSPASLSAAGITGVSSYSAAIYRVTDNPEYARALYATLLAAQARGATISVQLWGTHDGYLKMDRIWIYE